MSRDDPYRAFLEAKIATPPSVGLPCDLDEVRSHLTDGRPMKEHVRHIVRWAVQGGRRGIFASFGLHKTMIQLEVGRIICTKTGQLGLIVLPLGVRREFMIDADALWRSSGDRPISAAEMALMGPDGLAKFFPAWSIQDVYDHEAHVAIGEGLAKRQALPKTFSVLKPGSLRDDVWTDVARMRTLNGEQSRRGLENHICPLQFDIVDRAIRLYSNPGDLVLDPFAGLGTVPMRAVTLGRRGAGVELNEDYWRQAVRYCGEAASERAVPGLFDFLEVEAA